MAGCPYLQRGSDEIVICHTACADARRLGESRICDWSEYDPLFVPHMGLGLRARVNFDNGYAASIVTGIGLDQNRYEIAVLYNDDLVSDTPVTDDVVAGLKREEVDAVLDQIAALPAREVMQ